MTEERRDDQSSSSVPNLEPRKRAGDEEDTRIVIILPRGPVASRPLVDATHAFVPRVIAVVVPRIVRGRRRFKESNPLPNQSKQRQRRLVVRIKHRRVLASSSSSSSFPSPTVRALFARARSSLSSRRLTEPNVGV
jgi:hypothetical protein